ncbi:MAG: hypothetical protein RL215_2723 [Planctomycetota bacterium]
MYLFLRPVRLLLMAVLMKSTPRQMSLGFAFGVLLGLVPKGNLLAIALGLLLAATRLNLAVAALGAMFAAIVAVACDGLFDQLGWFVLTRPQLAGVWEWMYQQPFVPWTDFNHSIVMGSFVTGVVLILPVHFLTRPLFAKYGGVLAAYAGKSALLRIMQGVEAANRVSAVE